MTEDEEIIYLKAGYERLRSTEPPVRYGPLEGWPEEPWPRDFLRSLPAISQRIFERRQRTAEGAFLVEVPSPWHAYFYLRGIQQRVYRHEVGEHLFFRGQRCANWKFGASISRRSAEEAAVARRAACLLGRFFHNGHGFDPDAGAVAGRCFAQHYGISTDLIDISADADVGVWFATHPTTGSCPSGETRAIVRSVSWGGQINGTQTTFYIPPPYVRNVYRQRGLFLDASKTGGELNGRLKLDVLFPRETAGGEFKVYREGGAFEIWPEVEAPERELCSWATAMAMDFADDTIDEAFDRCVATKALPSFFSAQAIMDVDMTTDWLTILDWLLRATCVTAAPNPGGSPPMRYVVNLAKVDQLVDANPGFFGMLLYTAENKDFSEFPTVETVLKRAGERLGKR
jgi:hypothetical protein